MHASKLSAPPLSGVSAVPADLDQRVIMHGIDWWKYETMLAMRGESAIPRMTYREGVLELMSPSRAHEADKTMVARLLELWSLLQAVGLKGAGSWTIKKPEAARGAEPDECYFVGEERDDRPDIALEVVKSSGGIDKLDVYRPLGVPEVWFWVGERFEIFGLRAPSGEAASYVRLERSELLPSAPLEVIARYASRRDQETALREFAASLGVAIPAPGLASSP